MDKIEQKICDIIDAHRDELIAFGEDLWTHAELGFQEFRTQEFVVEVHFEPVDKKAQRETHIHDDREHGRLFRQFQSFVETVGTNVLRSLEQVKDAFRGFQDVELYTRTDRLHDELPVVKYRIRMLVAGYPNGAGYQKIDRIL